MKKLVSISAILLLAACATGKKELPMAVTVLTPLGESTANGRVHFQELADGRVEVKVDLSNVPPGVHGFHIHEHGACHDTGNAAGGHFNPGGTPHAGPERPIRHAGDFGNVIADPKGEVHASLVTDGITVSPGPNSVVGRAVILHAKPDDFVTQPTGNAGARIACGVIQTMKASEMHSH